MIQNFGDSIDRNELVSVDVSKKKDKIDNTGFINKKIKMLRPFVVLCILCIITVDHTFGMTREQLKKTMTIMKKQCMPKHGVTNAEVGEIEAGVFLEDHNVMCYIACIYKNIQVVRNNRLDKDLILRQIDILYPIEIREAVKKSVTKCVTVQNLYEDPCEGIFYATRCLYADDPDNFIFP